VQARAVIGRFADAWRALGRDQRLAALTSLGLFVSMLLPWYSKTVVVRARGGGTGTQSLSAFQAFSFVEAAVLLVSAGVLALLFARAEEREFHLPGGDGTIVMLAGAWTAILIFYRMLDKPGLQGNEKIVSSVGVEWGIFIALLVALGLAYVGKRLRGAEREEPPLTRRRRPDDDLGGRGERSRELEPLPADELTAATRPVPARRSEGAAAASAGEPSARRGRPRFPPAPSSEQMSFEDTPPEED
jgi:hypothetical protein